MIEQYTDPKAPLGRKAKILAVICTFVPEGQIEKGTLARSNIPPYEYHPYDENKLDSIKFNVACHEHYKPGAAYDIVIIDSSSPDKAAQDYLKSLPYPVHSREDVGFSFGSREFAYHQYKDQYDYFVFFDQDCVPTKDGWLSELLLLFHSEPNIGAVGVHLEHHNLSARHCSPMKKYLPILEGREDLRNFEGTFMFTSTRVLRDCEDLGGMNVLPVKGGQADGQYQAIWNELGHQLSMLEHGYRLLSMDDTHKYYVGTSYFDTDPRHVNRELAPVTLGHVRHFIEGKHFHWHYV